MEEGRGAAEGSRGGRFPAPLPLPVAAAGQAPAQAMAIGCSPSLPTSGITSLDDAGQERRAEAEGNQQAAPTPKVCKPNFFSPNSILFFGEERATLGTRIHRFSIAYSEGNPWYDGF